MTTELGSLKYTLSLDKRGFDKELDQASGRMQTLGGRLNNFSKSMSSIGKNLTRVGGTMTKAVTLPIVGGFGLAIKAASDLEETINKVDVSFKDQAGEVKKWAKTSIKSMGLAQQSALDAAALFGDMSTAMGLNTKQAAKMSTKLVQLGADMASFKNVSFDRAQTALAGIYTGETEALKQLGIVMTETNLAVFAQKEGITKNIKEMTQAEKVNLRYAYVMSVTKNAQGDFNRTSSSTANQIRQTQERFKELSAEIGQKLLPIANRLLIMVQGWIAKFQALSPETQTTIIQLAAMAAALGPVLILLGSLARSLTAIITLAKALRVAIILLSGPWGIAATLAVAAAILIWRHWNKILGFFKTVGRIITHALSNVFASITAPFRLAFDWIQANAERIGRIVSKINPFDNQGSTDKLFRPNANLERLRPGRASGGPVYPGGAYPVGERGMELFVPKRAGTIIPNDQIGQMMGSTTVNIQNVYDKSDVEYLMRRIDRNSKRENLGVSPA